MPLPVVVGAAVVAAVRGLIVVVGRWLVTNRLTGLVAVGTVANLNGYTVDEVIEAFWLAVYQVLGAAIGEELNTSMPLGHALADAITRRSGVPIRTLFDRDLLREDLEAFALDQLQAKSGYRLSSLTDAAKVKGDLQEIGLQIVQDRTGVPLAGAGAEPENIKAAITSWAEAQVYERLLASVPADDLLSGDDSVRKGADTLVAQIQARAGGPARHLSTRQVVEALNSHVLARSLLSVVQKVDADKVTRRRLQNRWAQKKFRERHKKREIYVPLGFVVETRYVGGGEDG